MAKVLDILQEVLIEIHPWYHERLRLYSELRSVIKNALTREDPEFFAIMVRLYNTARNYYTTNLE